MKPEIEKLIDFITTTVHPHNAVKLDLSEIGLKSLLFTASTEIEYIREHLAGNFFSPHKKNEVQSLVQNYQSVLIRLQNDLFTHQQNQKENNNLLYLYRSLDELLTGILTYIENYFSKYFNFDQEIPAACYLSNNTKFQRQIGDLKTSFKDAEDVELIAMVASHNSFFHRGGNTKTFTYRDLKYKKELISELSSLVAESSLYKSVRDVLFHANFNHIEFFKYLIDRLQKDYNKLEIPDAKLELLKYQRKVFRQTYIKEDISLFSPLPSIKEQVLNWIDEEIFFLESLIKPNNPEDTKKDVEPAAESKITVSLSVAQLAFFIRVLTLGKVITNINQSDIIRTFAANFKTSKTEEISYGSLYGKYFKPEASAIKEVKGVLLQLVSLVTKMKE